MNINWRVRPSALALAAILAAATTVTCAQAEYGRRPSLEQIALARDICVNVMCIRQGFVPFDACVESLSQTLEKKNTNVMVSQETDATYAINQPQQTSYSESRPAERRRKEEYACARLGIAPEAVGFGQCVAELDSALRSMEQSE